LSNKRALILALALMSAPLYATSVLQAFSKVVPQLPQIVLDSIMLGNLYFLIAIGITLTFTVAKFANFAHGDVATVGAYAAYLLYNFAVIGGIVNGLALELGIISTLGGLVLLALWYALRKKGFGNTLLALGLPILLTGLAVLFACYFGANLIDLIVIAATTSGITSLLSYLLVYKPLKERNASLVQLMVASIGVALFIRYALYEMTWYSRTYYGTEIAYQNFGMPITSYQGWFINGTLIIVNATAVLYFMNKIPTLKIGAGGIKLTAMSMEEYYKLPPQPLISFTDLYIWSTVTVIVIVLSLVLLFKKTKIGKAWRAVADNPILAAACGIDVESVINLAWLVAGALAGIGGLFWAMRTQIYPELGWMVLLNAFAVAVLGGLGSFWGTFAASYILAFAEQLGVSILAAINPQYTGYRFLIPFSVFLLVLYIKPEGLASIKKRRA